MPTDSARIAQIIARTRAEGPGLRLAIWFQGCALGCPGCCNPEMLDPEGGERRAIGELTSQIHDASPTVEGITLLGGEPLAQPEAAAALCEAARTAGLGVLVFSGYTLEELERRAHSCAATARVLAATDLLVDGRYRGDLPEASAPRPRRWVGSRNQQLRFLSARYSPEDPTFHRPNAIELRLDAHGALRVNGWPLARPVVEGSRR